MNLKYLAFSLFFFTSFIIQDSKIDLLCNKEWHAKYIAFDESKMAVPPGEENRMSMIFHKDGKHVVNTYKKTEEGKWEFTKNKDSLNFITNNIIQKSLKIETLNKDSLVISFTDENTFAKVYLVSKE